MCRTNNSARITIDEFSDRDGAVAVAKDAQAQIAEPADPDPTAVPSEISEPEAEYGSVTMWLCFAESFSDHALPLKRSAMRAGSSALAMLSDCLQKIHFRPWQGPCAEKGGL